MENTYLGILRGKMLPMEISAQMLIKGAEDEIFYLETKQISGYTTKLTLRNAIRTAQEQNPEDKQLKILLEELDNFKFDDIQKRAAGNIEQGQQLLQWIEK